MKVFAIKDIKNINKKDIAYLFYYENLKKFYIEINDGIDNWDAPLFFDTFIQKNEKIINSYWSKIWVDSRIIPSNRQNIGEILRNSKLDNYDEYKLLIKNKGRCSQDNYYLELIKDSALPKNIINRKEKRIKDILVLNDNKLLVFFNNGITKKVDVKDIVKDNNKFKSVLGNREIFNKVTIDVSGYGISFSDELFIDYLSLYNNGNDIDISLNDFINFMNDRIIDTKGACDILGCSKQNIDDLISRDKLNPIKEDNKYKLFLKSDILRRNWH